MKSFRNLPIGRKVALLIAGACTLTLVVTGLAMGSYSLWQTRASTIREFTVHARILAATTSAALVFDDEATADEHLRALHLKPHILHAFLLRSDGSVFSRFDREAGELHAPPAPAAPGVQLAGSRLLVSEAVVVDRQNRGTLVLEVDYAAIRRELLWPQFIIITVVTLASLLLALGFASILRSVVTRPLQRLAATATRISVERDYSVRAEAAGTDEIGHLSAAFNTMLARIEDADRALHQAHARLTTEMAERARLQDALVASSRSAGMAEVATSVLHNVGNVLNSVNVSANLLRERVDHARLPSLKRAVGLLRQHEDSLPQFLTEDLQGRQVLRFLEQICSHLEGEKSAWQAEIGNICRHIDHIKGIVAMQQNYAKPGGLLERVSPAQLFDDALRIKEDSCRRHAIVVERDFTEVAHVTVEKHSVIQILVNLLANAVNAVKAAEAGPRRITARVAPVGQGRVQFVVRDTGVGIAPETLARIFSHGFTTRHDGHGFGLHSGANAAKNLGGTLTAASAGRGHGAVFTLELPTVA